MSSIWTVSVSVLKRLNGLMVNWFRIISGFFPLLGWTVAGSKCHSKARRSWNNTCMASQTRVSLSACFCVRVYQITMPVRSYFRRRSFISQMTSNQAHFGDRQPLPQQLQSTLGVFVYEWHLSNSCHSPDNIIWLSIKSSFICKVTYHKRGEPSQWIIPSERKTVVGKAPWEKADTSSGSWLLNYAWEVIHWNEGRLVGDCWGGWCGGKWWD